MENVIKECGEEASISAELARQAIPTGAVSYTADQPEGCKRDVLFVYDLELPPDFEPRPQVLQSPYPIDPPGPKGLSDQSG